MVDRIKQIIKGFQTIQQSLPLAVDNIVQGGLDVCIRRLGPTIRVSGFHPVNVRCRVGWLAGGLAGWLHHGEHCQGVRTHGAGLGQAISADKIYQQTGGRIRQISAKLITRSQELLLYSTVNVRIIRIFIFSQAKPGVIPRRACSWWCWWWCWWLCWG